MMRRAPFVLVGTVVGLSSVLTFRSTPATIHLSLSGGAGSVGAVSTGGATTSTTITSPTTATSTSTVPTSAPVPTTTSAPTSNTVSSSTGVAVSHARCATTTSPSAPVTTTPAPTTSTIHSIPISPNGASGSNGFGGDDNGGNEGNDGTDMSTSGPIQVKLAASSVPSTRAAHTVTTTTICTAANGATPNVAKHKHPTTTVHHTPTTTVHHTPTTTKPPVTTTTVPPTTTTTVSATRTAVGATYNYNFGTMSVSVTVNGKTIKSVKVASLNDFGNGRSAYIDGQAIPLLINEAMSAQSAKIASISGASYTSAGFQASLQSALTKLGL